MMIGTQIGNDLLPLLYETLVFYWIAGFALYDLFNKRVPDRALVFFCPVALVSPMVSFFFTAQSFGGTCINSMIGAAIGFFILLSAALTTQNGAGIGGGDIKLAAVMGFIYGPYRMIVILLVASVLGSTAAFMAGSKQPGHNLSLPFVPFLAIGNLAAIAALSLNR